MLGCGSEVDWPKMHPAFCTTKNNLCDNISGNLPQTNIVNNKLWLKEFTKIFASCFTSVEKQDM